MQMLNNDMRLPMNAAEEEAVTHLVAKATATLTRRDPGETGPVLVHMDDASYEVESDGTVRRLD